MLFRFPTGQVGPSPKGREFEAVLELRGRAVGPRLDDKESVTVALHPHRLRRVGADGCEPLEVEVLDVHGPVPVPPGPGRRGVSEGYEITCTGMTWGTRRF